MLRLIAFLLTFCGVYGYFTVPGGCPGNIKLQDDFRLAEFYGKWYQVYHYSSDGQTMNNCSTIELITKHDGIYFNQSRVDRGLFHRYSIGKINLPTNVEDAAGLELTFKFDMAPRRLQKRRYNFHVLATNNKYYATVYTCQYSSLINKHFIYVWILSRNPVLNDVSKELATKPLQQIGVDTNKLIKNDLTKCVPKYYEDKAVEPVTFRFPVPI